MAIIKSLVWSEIKPPCETIRYDHITTDSIFGTLIIEWKSWKKYDSPGAYMPWGEYISGNDLEETKIKVEKAYQQKILSVIIPE